MLNTVIIKCTVHYVVHLQCSFSLSLSLSLVLMKVRDSDVLAWVRWQRKMSNVLGAFGPLDFTMLRPVLSWREFWNLWTVYFLIFLFFFRAAVNRGWLKPRIPNQRIRGQYCIFNYVVFSFLNFNLSMVKVYTQSSTLETSCLYYAHVTQSGRDRRLLCPWLITSY
jgi:hypothetical protein